MNYNIEFHTEAKKELDNMDGRERILVLKQINKIGANPLIGKELGNKAGLDLTGFKKIYVDDRKIRIVYKVIQDQLIIYIVSIGKRENLDVYKRAFDRV